jgi:beta-galactosidase
MLLPSGTMRGKGSSPATWGTGGHLRPAALRGSASRLGIGAAQVDRAAIAADGLDLAYVEADVVDAKGVLAPRASNEIAFSVTGPGALVGVDNGDSTNHEPYKGTTHAAFSGKAMAIIQSTTTAGKVTVQATSMGLAAGSVDIVTGGP